MSGTLARLGLRTVCREARCPNVGECWGAGTATVILLGDVCTRGCAFCGVAAGAPAPPDPAEPDRVAKAAAELSWRHVVVTSVTRDDLPDGGAAHFAAVVRALRREAPGATVELLVPDFAGNVDALRCVVDAAPDILAHNVETVPRLYPVVRKGAEYGRSVDLLRRAAAMRPSLLLKSGIMVGFGETEGEVARGLPRPLRRGMPVAHGGAVPAAFQGSPAGARIRLPGAVRPPRGSGARDRLRSRPFRPSRPKLLLPNPRYERQTGDAEHPAPGPRRVLRLGRGAGPPGTPREAGDRGRRRAPGRRGGRIVRGAPIRGPLGDADGDGEAALPGGNLPPRPHVPLRGDVRRGLRHLPPILPAGRAALHRRGVPRRHGVRAAVRRRGRGGPEDQGGGAGGDGADRFRRRRPEQVPREDRVGSREAGRPHGRSPRRGAGFPGPASGGEAVGGREGDGGGAPAAGDPHDRRPAPLVAGDAGANLRRARGAPARPGPRDRRPPRRDGTRGEVGRARGHLRPRSARPRSDAAGASFALRPGVVAAARAAGSRGGRSR